MKQFDGKHVDLNFTPRILQGSTLLPVLLKRLQWNDYYIRGFGLKKESSRVILIIQAVIIAFQLKLGHWMLNELAQ
jgi:hypothetical protein